MRGDRRPRRSTSWSRFAVQNKIDLVVVGPEAPLVKGLVDRLDAAGIRAFGPRQNAAEIEGSKGFMKDLCARHNIPTARYRRFLDAEKAKILPATCRCRSSSRRMAWRRARASSSATATAKRRCAIDGMMLGRQFGHAGDSVVVEEFLEGEELSFFALSDGTHALPLLSAQDHKRVGDGDTGPNTGGMGAYSPAPVATPEIEARIMAEIIQPTIAGMKAEGREFKGVLFAGIMVTKDGPKLIEFNARFGDPECQVMCVRMMSDIVPALQASIDGTLEDFALRWYPDSAVTVVMAARGYPGATKPGSIIRNLPAEQDDAIVFHYGTRRNAAGEIEAHGGRVLSVTALAKSVRAAQEKAYALVDAIEWPEGFCRRDIGWRAIAREQGTP